MGDHLAHQKQCFIGLLLDTRELLRDPKRIQQWDTIIGHFLKMSPQMLEEKFRYNSLYLIEKIIEPELETFQLSNLRKRNTQDHQILADIDRMLTDQMSSILPKILLAKKIVHNKQLNLQRLHQYISERNYKSCLMHDIINL